MLNLEPRDHSATIGGPVDCADVAGANGASYGDPGASLPAYLDAEWLKDEFLALLSHELRTPLATIKGFADLLLAEAGSNLTAEQREFLGIIAENAQREVGLIDQLLEFAGIRAGRVTLQLAAVDLVALLRGGAQRRFAGPGRLELDLRWDPGVHTVHCDGDRLLQVVGLMLEHCCQQTEAGGPVAVRVRQEGQNVCIEVSDPGAPLPLADWGAAFGGFHRLGDRSLADGRGLGLGLSIARGLARLHGGDLSVRQAPSAGTTMCLTLPIGDGQASGG